MVVNNRDFQNDINYVSTTNYHYFHIYSFESFIILFIRERKNDKTGDE